MHASCFVSITTILTLVLLGLDSTESMGVDMEDLKVCVCVCVHVRMHSRVQGTCAHACVYVCVRVFVNAPHCTHAKGCCKQQEFCDLNVILIVTNSDLNI